MATLPQQRQTPDQAVTQNSPGTSLMRNSHGSEARYRLPRADWQRTAGDGHPPQDGHWLTPSPLVAQYSACGQPLGTPSGTGSGPDFKLIVRPSRAPEPSRRPGYLPFAQMAPSPRSGYIFLVHQSRARERGRFTEFAISYLADTLVHPVSVWTESGWLAIIHSMKL